MVILLFCWRVTLIHIPCPRSSVLPGPVSPSSFPCCFICLPAQLPCARHCMFFSPFHYPPCTCTRFVRCRLARVSRCGHECVSLVRAHHVSSRLLCSRSSALLFALVGAKSIVRLWMTPMSFPGLRSLQAALRSLTAYIPARQYIKRRFGPRPSVSSSKVRSWGSGGNDHLKLAAQGPRTMALVLCCKCGSRSTRLLAHEG